MATFSGTEPEVYKNVTVKAAVWDKIKQRARKQKRHVGPQAGIMLEEYLEILEKEGK